MADRSFKVYIGEDLSPVIDLTDRIDWPNVEATMAAEAGEVGVGSIPVRDEAGSLSLPVKNRAEWVQGSNTLWRGRVQAVDYSRQIQVADRARHQSVTVDDYNIDLQGIPVDAFVRGPESDVARVQGLMAAYLSGNPRSTTNLNGSNYVSSSNTVTLAAKTYSNTEPLDILREIALETDKEFFVDVDGNLHYDGHDSLAFACPYYITDRPEEHDADPLHALTLIPNMGPVTSLEGQELSSHVRVYYTPDDYREAGNATVETNHAYWTDTFHIEGISASQAQAIANTLSARRAFPGRSYAMTVGNANGGPLTDAQIGSIKAGMMIRIKARVTPDAPDAFLWRRIRELTWSTPAPGQHYAHLRLDKRLLTAPRSGPLGPQPPAGPTVASCALLAAEMTQISTPNGDFETGLETNWVFDSIGANGSIGPATGGWEGNYYASVNGGGTGRYTGLGSTTFTAGQTYVFRIITSAANSTTVLQIRENNWGEPSYDEYAVLPVPSGGGEWVEYCLEWTPSATVVGILVVVGSTSGLDDFAFDNLRVYTGGSGDTTEPVGEEGSGTGGTDSGTYAPLDHVHAHGDLTGDFQYHDADQVSIDDSGGNFTADNVEDALAELAASLGTTDHGALSGLLDDDHTQYILKTLGGKEVVNTVAASGATETLNLADGNVHDVTLTANCTFTFSGATNGVACGFTLMARQDGTGSRTVTWPAAVEWPGGVAPTLSTTADAVDIFTFLTVDGGTTWFGFLGGSGGSSSLIVREVAGSDIDPVSEIEFDADDFVVTDQTGGVARVALTNPTLTADDISALGFVGPILISDTPSTPLVFADLIQNEAQDDLVYADV